MAKRQAVASAQIAIAEEDLERIRSEGAAVSDRSLHAAIRRRFKPRRAGSYWYMAELQVGGKYTIAVFGDAPHPPRQLLSLLRDLLPSASAPRCSATWKRDEDATILIPTGLAHGTPEAMVAAQRLFLQTLMLLEILDPRSNRITLR